MKIKKGDIVKVITGKDKGRQGRVVKTLKKDAKVVVEGMNVYKKHVKGDGREQESAIVDIVKPIDVSNVMLVCESCGEATRVGYEEIDGEKVRICKKCSKPVISSKAAKSKSDAEDDEDQKETEKDKDSKKDKKSKSKKKEDK